MQINPRTMLCFGLCLGMHFCGELGAIELQGDVLMEFPDRYLRGMLPLNGGLWLAVTAGQPGGEVWFSDLTPAGTALVKPLTWLTATEWVWLCEGPDTLRVGDTVFFTAKKPEEFGGGGCLGRRGDDPAEEELPVMAAAYTEPAWNGVPHSCVSCTGRFKMRANWRR